MVSQTASIGQGLDTKKKAHQVDRHDTMAVRAPALQPLGNEGRSGPPTLGRESTSGERV